MKSYRASFSSYVTEKNPAQIEDNSSTAALRRFATNDWICAYQPPSVSWNSLQQRRMARNRRDAIFIIDRPSSLFRRAMDALFDLQTDGHTQNHIYERTSRLLA